MVAGTIFHEMEPPAKTRMDFVRGHGTLVGVGVSRLGGKLMRTRVSAPRQGGQG